MDRDGRRCRTRVHQPRDVRAEATGVEGRLTRIGRDLEARLGARVRSRSERALIAGATRALSARCGLLDKLSREPDLAAILDEFVDRLQRAFGSLRRVSGKRILDIASGSNSSRSPATGRRTALFEPWFSRLVLELGGEPVAVDRGDLDGEPFEHHRVDLGRPGALEFLPAASFDGVQDSRLFGSPEFRAAYPRKRDQDRVRAEIKRQERRVLKPDGVLIHSDIGD